MSIWQQDNATSGPIKIWSDSLNAVQNSKKEWVSDKLRHIKTAYHFFKQYVKSGDIDLQHISGPSNCSDIFTKGYGEGAAGSPNQMAEAFREHALRCLGHRNCASDWGGELMLLWYFVNQQSAIFRVFPPLTPT